MLAASFLDDIVTMQTAATKICFHKISSVVGVAEPKGTPGVNTLGEKNIIIRKWLLLLLP